MNDTQPLAHGLRLATRPLLLAILALAALTPCFAQTNPLPRVDITGPVTDACFDLPDDLMVTVALTTSNAALTQVKLFLNGHLLDTQPAAGTNLAYDFAWLFPAEGAHVLTAQADFTGGITVTSAPVRVNIYDSQDLPIVSVMATEPYAWLPGPHNGEFTITRTGSTARPLNVYYGFASWWPIERSPLADEGVDFPVSSGWVTIPAGTNAVTLPISPLPGHQFTGRADAVMQLAGSPVYRTFFPTGSATVMLFDGVKPGVSGSITDGRYRFLFTAALQGNWYVIQASTSLNTWESVSTNMIGGLGPAFIKMDFDLKPGGNFYRLITLSPLQP